ncbi:hypothetical protein P170DRAFT_407389 [Aspergillus steynii IBT 23096]|uniref:DUF4334 domain-containing protein n=1 Tax=Aspergillus steynii IBT 23096 TaxID=1392250 RepID=A0A2I2G757_9EURO|nr:uncharacterized protein P170DRAFT_407389 [Aspergillus steynii IBT 23096]PLB48712.1 hypothetical protein P170DRAFT_407389 [Aspergillus steynii IBT 23096]
MSSVQEQYLALAHSAGKVDPSRINALFDQLQPIKPEHLVGEWSGGFFDTGHPVADTLKEIKWVGKSFKSVEHVDPVIVDRDGKRASWGQWGFATVRETVYRGVVSATMIYDDRPVFDHFRYVNENLLAGVMEGKGLNGAGDFFFYLEK